MLISELPNATEAVGPFAQQNTTTGLSEQVSDALMQAKYGGGGDSETAKRIEIQITPQENIFAGDPLKISSSSPTEIFVMRADVGENACYVAKQDYASGDNEAIGVKLGGVIALDTGSAQPDNPVYTAKGKGYTFTKTAEYYQQVGTVVRVGGNDGAICVSILELHENKVKEIVTGEAIAAENFCAINGNDGKAYIVTSANSNGLTKNEIYFAVTGGAIGETIQITASKYKVTGATGTANTPYYIGSDGFKTATVPSTSGDIVRKVGTYAQSVFTVNIDKTFFELSNNTKLGVLKQAEITDSDMSTLTGQDTTTGVNAKPHNRRVWYNEAYDRWDGIVYKLDGSSDQYIMTDLGGTPTFTSILLDGRNTARFDCRKEGNTIHVVSGYCGGTVGAVSRYYKVNYDPGTDTYTADPTIFAIDIPNFSGDGLTENTNQTHTMCIDGNGYIWSAFFNPTGLQVQRSIDGGATWLANPINVITPSESGIAVLNVFSHNGTEYINLFATENNGGSYYSFIIASNSADISTGNWTNENFSMVPESDDHLSSVVYNNDIYMGTKHENCTTGTPQQSLIIRRANGTFETYTAFRCGPFVDDQAPSRPFVIVSAGALYFCSHDVSANLTPGRGTGTVLYKKIAFDKLENLEFAEEKVLFQSDGSNSFNNTVYSGDVLGSNGLLLAATEINTKKTWVLKLKEVLL